MLPTIDLSGRTAFVTGSGSGIGRAIAHALAESGAHVYIAERSADTGADCAASITSLGGRATFVHCDVTDTGSIEAAIALATGDSPATRFTALPIAAASRTTSEEIAELGPST